jgi:hypothetical protein
MSFFVLLKTRSHSADIAGQDKVSNPSGDCGLRRELGTPVTAVRVVRIHLIDDDEVYQHIYRQERLDKSALTRCAPQSTPLRLPLRHNRPLPAPSRLLTPLDLALEGPRYPRQVGLGNWDHCLSVSRVFWYSKFSEKWFQGMVQAATE